MMRHPPDLTTPNRARVYDCLLGGTDNFPGDRELARQLADPETGYPGLPALARQNRRFILTAAGWLARRGIAQYLDLGCGLPSVPAVHEAAREHVPGARVVYADSDTMAVSHTAASLRGADGLTAVTADLRDPDAVLSLAVRHLDLSCPVAVILGAVLHSVPRGEARRLAARYAGRLAPGSAAVISVLSIPDPELARRARELSGGGWHGHTAADVQGWFTGAGLRTVRRQAGDVACFPLEPSGRPKPALIAGGIGIKAAGRAG